MSIRPLYDRILAKRVQEAEVSKGGIIIPDTAKEKPVEAMVVAVGNGKLLDNGESQALSVNLGDRIIFTKYSGTEVKIDGEDHIILREDDVMAVIVN